MLLIMNNNLSREIQTMKSNNHDNKRQTEMKNKVSAVKTSLEEIRRSTMTEESVNLLKIC